MSNLTFDEELVRDHPAEPLEGHTMVVMKRSGASGEKFHSLLEPGDDGPWRWIDILRRRPSVYFGFAVDASKHRLLSFSTTVVMAEHAHRVELHFSLWYRVSDAQLLVSTRASDPLGLLKERATQEVTDEFSEQSWTDVWHSFQTVSERVVAKALATLKNFARDYGIAINSLRLKPTFSEEDIAREEELLKISEEARLDRARADAARTLRVHEWTIRQEDAPQEEKDRALSALQKQQDGAAEIATDAYLKRLEIAKQAEVERDRADADREQQNRGWSARLEDAGLEEEVRNLNARQKRQDRLHDAGTETQARILSEADSADEYLDTSTALGSLPTVHVAPAHNGSNGGHAIRSGDRVSPLPAAETGLSAVLTDLVTHTEIRPESQCRRLRGLLLHVVATAVANDTLSAELVDYARRARVEIDAATNLPTAQATALLALADPHQLRERLYSDMVA